MTARVHTLQTRSAPVSDRVAECLPRFERVCRDVAKRRAYAADDLFQVARAKSIAFEPQFRHGGASFHTAVFKHVYGALQDHIQADRRDHHLRVDFAASPRGTAESAAFNPDGSTPDLFHEDEEKIRKRFGTAKQRLMGSIFLDLLATVTDPETAYILAEDQRMMRAALDVVFDDFEGEDLEILRRYFRDGEDLTKVLASLPGWSAKPYATGRRYVRGRFGMSCSRRSGCGGLGRRRLGG